MTRKVEVDLKVNECSQRPPIGPNGSKLDTGGPEGSIYPFLRVRPWLKAFEVQNCSDFEPKNLKNGQKRDVFQPFWGLRTVRKDLNMDLNCTRMPYKAIDIQSYPFQT